VISILRTSFADAERRERDVDAPGVRCEFLLQLVHVHDHLPHLRIRQLADVASSHDQNVSAERPLDEQVQNAPAHIASGPQQHRGVLLPGVHAAA